MSGRKCKISIGGEEIKPIGSWSIGNAHIDDTSDPINTSFTITWKILCSHEFKGELCGYTGDKTACKKTIESCRNNGNEVNFGGFNAMSFNGIEKLGQYHINAANYYTFRQISEREVEIETQFALNLNDIVHINDREYMCVRVRYNEGQPYRITLKQAGRHIFEQSGVKAGIAGRNLREEVIDNMNPKIRHEKHRFSEMTERQLWTRLGKITTLEKLGNFAYMAERFNKPDLAIAARARLDRLGGKPYREIIRSHMAKDTSLSNGDGERLLRKLDTI